MGTYDPKSMSSYCRLLLIQTLERGGALPYIKIWGFLSEGKYICAAAYVGTKNPLTGSRILEDVFWQSRGKLADTFSEKKALLKVFKHAEDYAKRIGFDAIRVMRDPRLHSLNKEGSKLNINNFYTRSGYEPAIISYVRKLN
jgi:hypothetical protein